MDRAIWSEYGSVFSTLEEQKPSRTLECAAECVELIQKLNDSRAWKVNNGLHILATPVSVRPADVSDNLQHEIIQMQTMLR